MYTLNRLLPDSTKRPVSHRLGQPISDDIACEVLEGETVEIGHDDVGGLLCYGLAADGVTEVWGRPAPGVQMEQNGTKRVVAFGEEIVAVISVLDDQRSYVKVFPTGLPVTPDPDA